MVRGKKTVLDHVIEWNRRKAKTATDPEDRVRYEENVANLLAYKRNWNKDDGS